MVEKSDGSNLNHGAPAAVKKEIFKDMDEKAASLEKMCFAMNGGAIVASLAFVGQLHSGGQADAAISLVCPTSFFLAGLLAIWLKVFFHMISLLPLVMPEYFENMIPDARARHLTARRIANYLFFSSFSFFAVGAIWLVQAILP